VTITSRLIAPNDIPHQTVHRFSVPIAPDEFQVRDRFDSTGITDCPS